MQRITKSNLLIRRHLHQKNKEWIIESKGHLQEISKMMNQLKLTTPWDQLRLDLQALREKVESNNLWQEQASVAAQLQIQATRLSEKLSQYDAFKTKYQDMLELMKLAEEEHDDELIQEMATDIAEFKEQIVSYTIKNLFSKEADVNGCFVELRAGSGGTESCDWVGILKRMYMRYAQSMNFDCKIVDEMASEIAGFKSVTLEIEGEYAHGWFQYEQGVHRFVRISPFDSNGKRHTSFVSVRIYPMMSDSVSEQIQISPADLKIETMRAGGAGGQHVNKTESAVRIVHLPTGLSVHSQSQRSQHQNKQKAMDMLKARLYELEIRKRESEKAAQHLTLEDNAWGSQIKSYVLHPYQMIKDLRTGHERNDVANVLDGDLGSFTETALVHHRKK